MALKVLGKLDPESLDVHADALARGSKTVTWACAMPRSTSLRRSRPSRSPFGAQAIAQRRKHSGGDSPMRYPGLGGALEPASFVPHALDLAKHLQDSDDDARAAAVAVLRSSLNRMDSSCAPLLDVEGETVLHVAAAAGRATGLREPRREHRCLP